jgi:acylphosphatase
MEDKLLYKIHVKGHVQGVGFRWSAAREARNLGIKGFIQNLPEGSVYIEAEGTPEQLKIFVDWCRKGPRLSVVESIKADPFSPVDYSDFRIE